MQIRLALPGSASVSLTNFAERWGMRPVTRVPNAGFRHNPVLTLNIGADNSPPNGAPFFSAFAAKPRLSVSTSNFSFSFHVIQFCQFVKMRRQDTLFRYDSGIALASIP